VAKYLAIADADRIHDYVFSPHELRLIDGGSSLQDKVNRTDMRELVTQSGGRVIRASGGTTLAEFENDHTATAFCQGAESLYRERLFSASATTAMVRDNGRFADVMEALADALERNKRAKRGAGFRGGNAFDQICQACGLFPASHIGTEPEQTERQICHACLLRGRHRSQGKWRLNRGLVPADDFEAMGRDSRPENYIVVVYLDLDRLGRYLNRHAGNDSRRYAKLSKNIDHAVRDCTYRAVKSLGDRSGIIILSGGDDAIVALRANGFVPFLRTFQEAFNVRTFLPGIPRPTFSAGAVIAHSHYPIFEFRRISEDLLRSAKRLQRKRLARQREDSEEKPQLRQEELDSIDYEILTASMTGDVIEQRETIRRRSGELRRTAKPYALTEFLDVAKNVAALKKEAPASKIKGLYQIAYEGRYQGELDYLYLLSRLNKADADNVRCLVGGSLWRPRGTNGDEGEVTFAADVAELWEFVE